jgi:acetyl esterase/lipase
VASARLILDFLAGGRTLRYGPHRSQRVDLYLPAGTGPHAVVVLIHGGSWRRRHSRIVMRGLAGDLLRRGFAVWNIEYRRLGEGGGWPATFADVAAAIDLIASVQEPLDPGRVSVVGHSAGGHLALWAAVRDRLPAGAPGWDPAIAPRRTVAQAPVCDLAGAYRLWRGAVVGELMGGGPDEVPERYAVADPIALPPPTMPTLLVHGTADRIVSVKLSRGYLERAVRAGGEVELVELEGDAGAHRRHVDPRGPAWGVVTEWLRAPRA